MDKTIDTSRPFDMRRLMSPMNKGGAQAEAEYALYHKLRQTQKLKRKYTHK